MKFKFRSIYAALAACGIAFSAPEAHAYLGGFETDDGYWIGGNSAFSGNQDELPDGGFGEQYGSNGIVRPTLDWVGVTSGDGYHGPDVTRYNAGAFGTNNGGPGGTAVDIVDDSGLWKRIQGGRSLADLNPGDNAVLALNFATAMAGPSYSGSNSLTIISEGGELEYSYDLDARDMDFPDPLLMGGEGIYTMSYMWCPDLLYTEPASWLSLIDGAGSRGLRIGAGYAGVGAGANNYIYLQDSTGVVDTTLVADSSGWTSVDLTIDTATNTYEISMEGLFTYDAASGTYGSGSYFRTGILENNMSGFTQLNWWQADSQAKNYYDDFDLSFTPIPEPSQVFLLSLGGAVMALRRGRARKPHSGHTIENHPSPPANPSASSGCPGAEGSRH